MRSGYEGLMVGRTLAGRYEVLEAVARGGMSVVFRGRDGTLGREVAVKVVSLAGASDQANFRERFRREAGSAARIQHPNVVQIFDYGTDPELELDFIVMELLRGHDLKEAMREGTIPTQQAIRILADAARGVAAGHRAGIVHRDVKPANVFLVGDGEIDAVKILDFGIAKPMEDDPEQHALTTIGSLPHSPAYASPEQLDPDQPVTAASDVYQLGLIGYEMLAGRRPFGVDERARIRGGEEVPLPVTDAWRAVPSHISVVIQRALAVRPAERYPDASAFAEALLSARDEDEATAFHPVAVPLAEPDATELVDVPTGAPTAVPVVPVASAAPAPPVRTAEPRAEGIPVTPPPRRPALPKSPLVWAVPLLLLVAIALWAARRGGDEDADPAAAAALPADSGRLAALDSEFVRLQGVVAQGAAARQAASPAQPAAPGTTPTTVPSAAAPNATPSTVPAATGGDVLARARAEITAAVRDLNAAWVQGEIGRHVGHYASRVDYYNSNNLPRSGVRRDRTRDLRRYDERRIELHSIGVEFLEPDRARVLVDKEWVFGGDGRTRQGRGMQEYVFKRDEDDGKWYVVSEQLLTTTEARSPTSP
jgi:eukaryotic-like serine/threonine-protein kinase